MQVLFGETRKTFTHQPIKFLQIAKAIKPKMPKTKLLILSEQSVRINYETSRFKCNVNKRVKYFMYHAGM